MPSIARVFIGAVCVCHQLSTSRDTNFFCRHICHICRLGHVATRITACNDHLFHVCEMQGYLWMKCRSMVRGHRVICKLWEFWCCPSGADQDLEYVSSIFCKNSPFTIVVEKATFGNRIPLDISSDDITRNHSSVCPVDNET
ncbi:hypothetical protein IscW_ISCW011535 [Ixodes scapularis]|uniref:Uncharacterized protein n=1 Tax=Ixodes scapularis TaxID=6945 RepID=B7Q749_IXOSC|nr:hypothetical protein IscW_ISCW011535 [Ixodes scapularis]|eukprot:XP_002412100.1 hypothetical protein IscW_ISCW011535 [Ixodes scapularis]